MNTHYPDEIINFYNNRENVFILTHFKDQVVSYFQNNPLLNEGSLPIVHSIKSRLKDPEHLRDKLLRKQKKGQTIEKEELFSKINDLIGIRLLHLYQDQFPIIHNEILKNIEKNGNWELCEAPKAYTWDPESLEAYKSLEIETEIKETLYTSVHYVIKPNNDKSDVTCEIQVRTLFEEIWGEIDHTINYPHPTNSIACQEQIKVLSKLVSAGTRLADSIFRTHKL